MNTIIIDAIKKVFRAKVLRVLRVKPRKEEEEGAQEEEGALEEKHRRGITVGHASASPNSGHTWKMSRGIRVSRFDWI
jgi:hypothetical protein